MTRPQGVWTDDSESDFLTVFTVGCWGGKCEPSSLGDIKREM